jgi:CHAT domain-containing protein
VVSDRRDFAQAEEYYLQALAIQEKLAPDSVEVAKSLNNLGGVVRDQGDTAKAEEHFARALSINKKLAPGGLEVAASFTNLGDVASHRRDFAQAEEYHRQALAIQEKLAPGSLAVGATLNNLSKVAKGRGDLAKAEEHDRRALAIQEKLAPGSLVEATTLFTLASNLLGLGQKVQAITYFERSVSALERQTRRLGGTDEVRASYRSQYSSYYLDYISALLDQKQPERALYVLERFRARSLLAMLAERDLVFAVDVPVDIQRERKLNAAAYDRTQDQIAQLNQKENAAQIDQLLARMRALTAEREHIAERVKRISPRYAALQYPQPLELVAIQRTLDSGTVLFSYLVAKDKTYLFVVDHNGAEPAVSVHTIPVGETDLRDQILKFRGGIEEFPKLEAGGIASNVVAAKQHARALYDLLVRPAEAQLDRNARLLIAPDGPLHTLPFAALLRSEEQYLIEWKSLHMIVSATVYGELKKTRINSRIPLLDLVAFGNPLYPKQGRRANSNRSGNSDVRFAGQQGLNVSPLPFSKDEVENAAKLFQGRSEVFLGAKATEERAKSESPRARYIHFAAHGFLDPQFPLNSGLVLTIPDNSKGRENGLLQAWEIFEQMREHEKPGAQLNKPFRISGAVGHSGEGNSRNPSISGPRKHLPMKDIYSSQ